MKRQNIMLLIGYALIFLFVYTAFSKLFAYNTYLYDLRRSPELGAFAVPISILIPGAELLSAAFILLPRFRRLGFLIATVLMTAFTLYVAYVVMFAEEQPCTCGGIIRELSWPQHLVFNIFFTVLAAIGLRLSKYVSNSPPSGKTATAFH